MNRIAILWILTLGPVLADGDRPLEPVRTIRAESAYLRLIDQVDIPSRAAGVLSRIGVREGSIVNTDDLLAQLDDVDARLALERAKLDLEVARRQAGNHAQVEATQTAVREAEATRDKARLELQVSERKAASEIAVRYARKAASVAKAELQRAQAARRDVRDSVSQNEIEHLQLGYEKVSMEVEQAEYDLAVAGLQSRAKQAEVVGLESTVRRKDLEAKQANHELEVAQLGHRLKEHDLTVAQRELERRRIQSPLAGVIVQIHRQPGEWVEPGDRVLRIVRLNRLRAEGFLPARELRRELTGLMAKVTVTNPDQGKVTYQGTVVFVSPEIDPVNGQVLVWAEVDNPAPAFALRPGMRAEISIELPADR